MPKVSRWLVLALAASPPGCFLNPFPELPGETEASDNTPPGAGGSSGTGSGGAPGTGGSVAVSGGTSGAEGGSGGTGGSGSGGLAGAPSAGVGGANAGTGGLNAGGAAGSGFAGSGFGGSGFAGGAPLAGASGEGMGGAGSGGIGGAGDGGMGAAGAGAAGAGGTTDPMLVRGTCDLRLENATCREVIDTAEVVAAAEETCVLESGLWSEAACPTTEALIGCCAYTATTTYRDCTYQGGGGNPAAACTQITGAIWTPAD